MVLTIDWDAFDSLSLSGEIGDKSGGEMTSCDFRSNCSDKSYVWLMSSVSETHDIREGVTRSLSRWSYNEGNMRSKLGLSELTKDISVSNKWISPYDFPFMLDVLGNGDLLTIIPMVLRLELLNYWLHVIQNHIMYIYIYIPDYVYLISLKSTHWLIN